MIKKLFSYIPGVVGALLLAWIGLSWFDIIADNCSAAPAHSDFNIFVLFLEVIQ